MKLSRRARRARSRCCRRLATRARRRREAPVPQRNLARREERDGHPPALQEPHRERQGDVLHRDRVLDANRCEAPRRHVRPKLANARGTKAVQVARIAGKTVVFPGTVDFSPEHVVVPSTDGFPPSKAVPGAVGDARYSPLVSVLGSVLDAPQVANASGKSDSIVSIDTKRGRVTLKLLRGFFNGTSVLYLAPTPRSRSWPRSRRAPTRRISALHPGSARMHHRRHGRQSSRSSTARAGRTTRSVRDCSRRCSARAIR